MLTMLEEVVLLAVDERNGGLRSAREYSTAYALVGAVVFDLALAKRIDTDTEEVVILDTTPTGNATSVLDRETRCANRNHKRFFLIGPPNTKFVS